MNNKRQLVFETKVLDAENRIIEMVGSTEDFDRVGDRMSMNGVQLQNYLKNPVILQNHNYELPAIAKALEVRVMGSQLIFKIQFAETEDGKEWFYLYANKYMNASSIGFQPINYEPNEKGGYDFLTWELLELSLVTVPCNPNAIQRAFKEGKISKALFDSFEKEESEMNKEEIQALINETVTPLQEKIKSLEEGNETKDNMIKTLEDKVKELEEKPIEKAGAAISQANKSKLKGIHEDLCKCMKALGDFVGDMSDEPDDGKGYEPTAKELEEISKLAANQVAEIVKKLG